MEKIEKEIEKKGGGVRESEITIGRVWKEVVLES